MKKNSSRPAQTKSATTASKRTTIKQKLQKGKAAAGIAKVTASKKTKVPDKPSVMHLSSVWQLSRKSLLVLWDNKGLFIGITLIYGFFDLIVAQGLPSSNNITKIKGQITTIFHGHAAMIGSGISTFLTLDNTKNTNTNSTSPSGVYQFFLVIIVSLAIIWALRQVMAGRKNIKIRDPYYKGMYPFIPFIITLLIIGVQLLPLLIGATLYTTVVNNGIAASGLEKIIWLLVFLVSTCWTLYMVSGSAFALYAVTLPEMTPVSTIRNMGKMVRHHRSVILRKLLFLPCALLVAGIVIMVPVIRWLTPIAKIVYFMLAISVMPVVHSYLYNLYEELVHGGENN